jgi:curved DNA-binding protein CbpA
MKGKLAQNPLAELIREIVNAELSGALRLSRERATVIAYFDGGQLVFAASNLRPHRLSEVLKRNGFTAEQLRQVRDISSDADEAAALLNSGVLTEQSLQKFRSSQAADVMRTALLWTDGEWSFDPRVRVTDEHRVEIDVGRLLRESARHLPLPFIKSRFGSTTDVFSIDTSKEIANLSPIEEFIVSRTRLAPTALHLPDLIGNGLPEEEGLRCVYALSLAGLLQRSEWLTAFDTDQLAKLKRVRHQPEGSAEKPEETRDKVVDVESFLARMDSAKDHYEILDVARGASLPQIKAAYHFLARHFHPDRFHQEAPALRNRTEDAFARVARAYEILNDPMRRAEYDQTRVSKPKTESDRHASVAEEPVVQPRTNADNSFRQGMDALQRKEYDNAIRFLAEAAILEPKQARYRAHYGYALMNRPKARRAAEAELLAALALEPNNAKFRLMLAEVYQSGGMRRRAESEAARALTIDPKNEKARALLESLRKK